MPEITLIVCTAGETSEVPLDETELSIGRGDDATLVINDAGLSRLHATIHQADGEIWIVDENSTNGTEVNGEEVTAEGFALSDGDEITLGDETTITIRFADYVSSSAQIDSHRAHPSGIHGVTASRGVKLPPAPILALILAAFVGLIGVVVLSVFALTRGGGNSNSQTPNLAQTSPAPPTVQNNNVVAPPSPVASQTTSPATAATTPNLALPVSDQPPTGTQTARLYRDMTEEQKIEFIARRARHISMMMTRTDRPYEFNDDVVRLIKYWVDAFARRVGARGTHLWGGDMRAVYHRGIQYAPMISAAFQRERVPPIVGLYLPVIETEYVNIQTENHARAKGLFQFIPGTARGYGIHPDERTNVPVMAGAAARHIRDNMIQFGDDSMSVAFAIAGYNRATHSLLRDLRTVISNTSGDAARRERDFWTLIANQGQLDHYFQNENKNYVPRFFAAAILGETPWAFDLQMRQLSTYATEQSTPNN
jgi:hypothetical protein